VGPKIKGLAFPFLMVLQQAPYLQYKRYPRCPCAKFLWHIPMVIVFGSPCSFWGIPYPAALFDLQQYLNLIPPYIILHLFHCQIPHRHPFNHDSAHTEGQLVFEFFAFRLNVRVCGGLCYTRSLTRLVNFYII